MTMGSLPLINHMRLRPFHFRSVSPKTLFNKITQLLWNTIGRKILICFWIWSFLSLSPVNLFVLEYFAFNNQKASFHNIKKKTIYCPFTAMLKWISFTIGANEGHTPFSFCLGFLQRSELHGCLWVSDGATVTGRGYFAPQTLATHQAGSWPAGDLRLWLSHASLLWEVLQWH